MFTQFIRKIAPIAASAVMLGSTLGLAAAADLSQHPQPFVSAAGVADVAVVIGKDAQPVDVIAAGDIVASLVVPTGTGTSTVTSGGVQKNIPVGYSVADGTYGWSTALTDTELPNFQDRQISIDIKDVSNTYLMQDELNFTNAFDINTGLNVSSPRSSFKDGVFFTVPRLSITYVHKFADNSKAGNYIANASTDEPVVLRVLGNDLEITKATATSITARVGERYTLKVGESTTVAAKTLKMVNVGSDGTILVDVDGTSATIASGATKKVAGLRIKNDATFYSTTTSERQATVISGEDTLKTYNNADPYIGQNKDRPEWTWQLSGLDGSTPKISIINDQTYRNYDDVYYVGSSIKLPNDFVTISLASLTAGKWSDFKVYSQAVSRLFNSTGGDGTGGGLLGVNSTTQDVLVFEATAGKGNGFKMPSGALGQCASAETDKFYLWTLNELTAVDANLRNISVYFQDRNDKSKSPKFCGTASDALAVPTTIVGQYESSTFNIDIGNVTHGISAATQVRVTIGRGEQQQVNLTINATSTGLPRANTRDATATASDVVVSGGGGEIGTTGVGTFTENLLTVDGLKIYNPKSNAEGNQFKFALPQDEGTDFRATVTVTGKGAAVSTTGTQFTKPPIGISVLDSEIDTVSNRNLIVIGDSCVNQVAAKLANVPYQTCGAGLTTAFGFGPDEAVLKMYTSPYAPGKTALLVAGWEGPDTRRAAKSLATGVPKLSGESAVLVTLTDQVTVKK